MYDRSLSRRHVLAGGLAAGLSVLAGCVGIGNDTATEESDTVLRLSLAQVDGPLRERYVHERDDPDDNWDVQALDAA